MPCFMALLRATCVSPNLYIIKLVFILPSSLLNLCLHETVRQQTGLIFFYLISWNRGYAWVGVLHVGALEDKKPAGEVQEDCLARSEQSWMKSCCLLGVSLEKYLGKTFKQTETKTQSKLIRYRKRYRPYVHTHILHLST